MIHSFSFGAYNRVRIYEYELVKIANVIQMIQDPEFMFFFFSNMTCSAYDVLVYCTSTVSVSHRHTKNREDQVSAVPDRIMQAKQRTVRQAVDDTGLQHLQLLLYVTDAACRKTFDHISTAVTKRT